MNERTCSASSSALLTDLYQITMAYAYWHAGIASTRRRVFMFSFRENPFKGGFTVACGLAQVAEYLKDFHFTEEDLRYLSSLTGADAKPLFPPEFLEWLLDFRFTCDVTAVQEGTLVFPGEPLLRVTGPIVQCQLIETAILNIVNFQTLIATKAARVCLAAEGD